MRLLFAVACAVFAFAFCVGAAAATLPWSLVLLGAGLFYAFMTAYILSCG